MANLRNEFEFRSALLTALGQEHTEAEAKNEEMWRRKMLDGLGVEYDQNDVNQFGLFREKLIEGVTSKSEGGGGSSDFSTAEVTVSGATGEEATVLLMPIIEDSDRRTGIEAFDVNASPIQKTYNVPLYKGHCLIKVNSGDVDGLAGNVTLNRSWLDVTGNCSLIGYYVQN